MATVQEAVKESLLGTTREPQLSQQAKANFDKNSAIDDSNGERYMTEDDFVNAIAPTGEDYVSLDHLKIVEARSSSIFCTAQDKARPICNTIPSC